jgi:hypothetical protein
MKINLSDLNESYQLSYSVCAGYLPSGIYEARLVHIDLTFSKNGNRQIRWILEAQLPSGTIATTMKFSPLVPHGMRFLRKDLDTLRVYLDDLNDLPEILPELIGTVVKIEITDNIDARYHRVDFLKKISNPEDVC